MPTNIQQGRTLAALIQKFGIKGRHLLQLDEVVVPVVIVEDVRASEIKGTGFATSFFEAALAGEGAVCRFIGEGNATTLPQFLAMRPHGATAGFLMRLNTTAVSTVLTGPVLQAGRNRFNPTQPDAATRVEFGTAVAVTGDAVRRITAAADETVLMDLRGWRVPPGAVELQVICETVNTAVSWSAQYDTEFADS